MAEPSAQTIFDLAADGRIRDAMFGQSKLQYAVMRTGTVELFSVRTPAAKRERGEARRALSAFLAEADAAGLQVKLVASPLDKRTSPQRLVAFYESLGFSRIGRSANAAGDPVMSRTPVNVGGGGADADAAPSIEPAADSARTAAAAELVD